MADVESQATATITKPTVKKEGSSGSLFGKGKYKLWVLSVILLLAFWSMFTGSVTLKWSAGGLHTLSDGFDSLLLQDLDILELEDREKVVRHMWDVYTHGHTIRLPRFWQEAFEAAYEDLTSENAGVRNAAVSSIAKFSLRSIDLEPHPLESTVRAPEKEDGLSGKLGIEQIARD